MKHILKTLIYFTFCVCAIQLEAQVKFVQKLDSISMLIGDQRHLILTSSHNEFGESPFTILDTLSWFHIIDRGKWIGNDQKFERNIIFTVFDSGYFRIPPVGVFPSQDSTLQLGDPLNIEVNYPNDSLNILRPIKSIEETESVFRYFYIILLGILFIAGMLFVLWHFFKADRVKPSFIEINKEKKIWEQCIQSLNELKEKKLWQNNQVKEYYDELNFILRTYLSAGLKINALENTSSEIIEHIQNDKPEIKEWQILKDCFRESDFAKFANVIPQAEQNERWMTFSKNFIESNKDLSELILEQTRVHWLALLGDPIASQFENPLETVPDELVQLHKGSINGSIELLHNFMFRIKFQLPESWVKWHEMHTGIFYRWQLNILNKSKHKLIRVVLMIFVLPFITLFLPFIIVINIWKKQDIFSRGVFGLSPNNKLVLRKRK